MKWHVLVLMSTYNGEKYLREQIDSILTQQDVDVDLLVRDDGSKDDTLKILDEYQSNGKLTYYTGPNLGPQRSFMHLLQNAPKSEYYAFADQDDVWMKDKLSCAITKLSKNEDKPALYFSQTQVTDENLNLRKSVKINPLLTFGESLIYKYVNGCTMVFNHNLRQIISNQTPKCMPMHDMWIYAIAMAFDAHVVFDPTPHILYRQHTTNAVGAGHGFMFDWNLRIRRFLSHGNIRSKQAEALKYYYGDNIPEHNLRKLTLFLEGKHSFIRRIAILFNKDFRCSDRTTQILFWINLLANKY